MLQGRFQHFVWHALQSELTVTERALLRLKQKFPKLPLGRSRPKASRRKRWANPGQLSDRRCARGWIEEVGLLGPLRIAQHQVPSQPSYDSLRCIYLFR